MSHLYVGCLEAVESTLTVCWREVEGETADISDAVPGTHRQRLDHLDGQGIMGVCDQDGLLQDV